MTKYLLQLLAFVIIWDIGLYGINALPLDKKMSMSLFALYTFLLLQLFKK